MGTIVKVFFTIESDRHLMCKLSAATVHVETFKIILFT